MAEGERLTPDAPRNGERRPLRGHPSASARKGARREAGAGSPHPHQPHSGYTGHRTPAAGRGTASDTRRPSQRWQASPPGNGPPTPPRHAAPPGQARQGDSARPPQPHARAHSTWTAGPSSPQEEGSRRRESARPRTPLATGSPILHGPRGEHLKPIHTHERWPAGPGYELPNPRPATPTARTPATGNPRPAPALRHSETTMAEPAAPRKTRPRSPTLDAAHEVIRALGLRGGEGDPPTGGRGRGLRPGENPGALSRQHARGTCAAGGQRAHPLPRVETGPLHRKRLVPQATPPTRPR